MPTEISRNNIEAAARKLIDAKMESVRDLVETRLQIQQKEQDLAEARRVDSLAYTAALRAGWTSEELKKLDLQEPAPLPARPRGRTAATGRTRSAGTSAKTAANQEPAADPSAEPTDTAAS